MEYWLVNLGRFLRVEIGLVRPLVVVYIPVQPLNEDNGRNYEVTYNGIWYYRVLLPKCVKSLDLTVQFMVK